MIDRSKELHFSGVVQSGDFNDTVIDVGIHDSANAAELCLIGTNKLKPIRDTNIYAAV